MKYIKTYEAKKSEEDKNLETNICFSLYEFISKIITPDLFIRYKYGNNNIKINTKNGENVGYIFTKLTTKKITKENINTITIHLNMAAKKTPFLHKLSEFIIEELRTPKIHREANTKIDSNQFHYNEKYDISFYKENVDQLINAIDNLSAEKFIIQNTANKYNL